MNIHVLQTVESQAEARNIMAVKYQLVSPQSNRPVMGVIQDSLCGAYLLSDDNVTLSREEMMHCVLKIPGWDGVFHEQNIYTGKDLISYTLPMVNWSKGNILIEKGKFISGRMSKKVLGRSDGSLIHVMYNDCGPDETILFINRLQRVVHAFLSIRGFSVGIGDMLSNVSVREEIDQAFIDVDGKSEQEINQRLNICRDTMGTMVQKPLNDSNRLYTMVHSGSKGSNINISQIMAVVGQQNLCGSRIPNTWTNRTLPHFKHGSSGPKERGFIQHSYVEGLDPHEVWFHAISGREGLIDTAIKTSTTGYLQRRFMKALENITISYDGSARNADGSVIQFQYGDDGFDPMRIENQYIPAWDVPGKDGDYLHNINKWRDNGTKDTAWFQLPIPIKRIIHNTKTLFAFPSEKVSEEQSQKIIDSLLNDIDNEMIRINIRSHLKAKNDFTVDELEHIAHKIREEYQRVQAIPGESVGAIAAQSIGEPATQMTLNTFHFAGVSSMNVTLGIPRLEELINCTKGDRLKTPLTIIHTENPDELLKTLKHIRIGDLVKSSMVTTTPDVTEVGWYHIFPDLDLKPLVKGKKTLVLYLKEWYDVSLIKRALDLDKVTCAYTDGPKPIFHIQLFGDLDPGMYYEQVIKMSTIRGIPGAEQTIKVKPPGKQKYHIETSLYDLNKLFELDFVDISLDTINTNDIHMVAETFGIEAARNTIIREIRQILAYYGIYVNVRHITLAVDWMTWIGSLTPLTRHGIRKVDKSPLKRATFEEVVEVFNQAACAKEVDHLNGISECIITGTPPKSGTNQIQVILDEVIERENAIPFPENKWETNLPWEDAEDDEEEIYGTQDPWADERQPWEKGFPTNLPQANVFPPLGFPSGLPPGPGLPGLPWTFQAAQVPPPTQINLIPGMQAPPVNQMSNVAYDSPVSPAYSPASPAYSPTSPAYDPNSPKAYSPTSPAYDPTSPMSPAYDPTSPMSPAYDPTSPMSPAYDPGSPMSPAYDGSPSQAYDPNGYVADSPQESKKRRTYY